MPAARVIWDAGQCLSADHGDRYFSPDAATEVSRVFMSPVDLIGRLKALPKGGNTVFTCGELGFGTGLNAAVIIETFLKYAPPSARLHFISFERNPLAGRDLQHAARQFESQLPAYREIAKLYPPLLSGWHRLHLAPAKAPDAPNKRVILSLFFGDARLGLADIQKRQRRPVNHWLLDGFAPKKNPSLWQPELFEHLAELSTQGTSLATYSAVGEVRRALQQVGFAMRKVDQMPIKLHSLAGEFARQGLTDHIPVQRIQIIGAGIGGVSVARGLAERNIPVSLIEPAGKVAQHASRIPAAVLHGRLRDDGSPDAAWQAMSYHYSDRRLRDTKGFKPMEVRQISGPNADPERLQALVQRYASSGDWLETQATPGTRWRHAEAALRFGIGGAVHGPTLCQNLANHPLITLRETPIEADISVIASGFGSRAIPEARYLEIAALAGQAELCAHPMPPNEAIVGAGYMAPCRGGMVIGSTYEYKRWQPEDAVAANLKPWLDTGTHRGSFRAHRTITSDRVCIVGNLYDKHLVPADHLRIITGFGSTGMSSAPLAGECIAAELACEFAPITRELERTISSLRFRTRQARRGPRMGAEST